MADPTTHRIDGDLLTEVIVNSCPLVLSVEASRRTAEQAVAQLAQLGVTVTRGPDSTPWKPDSCGQHTGRASNRCLLPTGHSGDHDDDPPPDLEQLVTERTGKLLAAVTDRDRTITELRAKLDNVVRRLDEARDERDALGDALKSIAGYLGVPSDLGSVLDAIRGLRRAERAADQEVDRLRAELAKRDRRAAEAEQRTVDLIGEFDQVVQQRDKAREERDQWIARHVRAGDALTRICGQLREITDEHTPADDDPLCAVCNKPRGDHLLNAKGHLFVHPNSPYAKELRSAD